MGEIKYKCTPHGWSEDRAYLVCKKVILNRSGVALYEVVSRWCCGGVFDKGFFTETSKGVQYTKYELSKIEIIE